MAAMNNPGMPSNVPDFVTNHLRRYLDTNGEDGHLWDSTGLGDHGEIPTLLLTIPDLYGIAGQDGAGDSDRYPGKGITVLGGSR